MEKQITTQIVFFLI
uniref:Uncharacterized protein n=1 Tax=Anguilla anguilla TaxID=7936 RepID=A0A0E9W7Y1_ANGAN